MKRRTPLRRGKRLRSGRPLRRKARLRKVNAERIASRREVEFGPQADLCRTLPCCACGERAPSDPHHVRSRGAGGKDSDCAPLCRECHGHLHQVGIRAFEESRGIDLAEIAREIGARL